ncbi:DUF5134 domain-containing protein, partial [Streptomyces coeruleorubidus]
HVAEPPGPPHRAASGRAGRRDAAEIHQKGPRAGAHHLHHLVGAGAMVYMSVVMAGAPAHAHGQGGSGVPLLTGALLLYFAGYVLLTGVRLVPVAAVAGSGAGVGGSAGWGDRPELARACRLSMGISMVAMLLTL